MAQMDPIACSLPARESKNQIGEWQALVEHQVEISRVDGGYAMTYDAGVADLVEDLARRESACCDFLSITTERISDGVRMTLTSPNPDALPVIEILVGAG